MKRRSYSSVLSLLATGLLLVSGCSSARDPWEGDKGSPRIVVTMAPLYSFVRAVGGDRVGVRCLCTTTGPHHYATDASDARLFRKANIVFTVGLRLDESFADALSSLAGRSDLPVIRLGEELPEKDRLKLQHQHPGHSHGTWDPHIWLGINEAISMTKLICEKLCQIDEANAAEYRKNTANFVERLKKLQAEGKKALAQKKVKRIISFHEALSYFARSFDLEIADVIEQGPGDEPSSIHLTGIVKLCQDKAKPIGAITVEPQYPKSSSADIVQRELRGKGIEIPLVEIDPMETVTLDDLVSEGASWYEKRMTSNVQALVKALK